MDLKIYTPKSQQAPHYEVNLLAPPQPFFHTLLQFTGAFGRILLTRIDLRLCTIWIIRYNITESLTIRGRANDQFCQLTFRMPVAGKERKAGQQALPPVHLSITDTCSLRLLARESQMICVHYQLAYFNSNGTGTNGNLKELFQQQQNSHTASLYPNDAILTIMQQIISASPSHRIVHLYLEAKVKELLVMLHEQRNPSKEAGELSQKEIESLDQVKEMLLTDLSRSWTLFELARHTGINAFRLKTGFRNRFGIHLHLFQHNCRMEKASHLLQNTTLSIKEIAFAVGYKNVSNFSESFKKYYGYPPSRVWEAE